jgi:hypothetical protein
MIIFIIIVLITSPITTYYFRFILQQLWSAVKYQRIPFYSRHLVSIEAIEQQALYASQNNKPGHWDHPIPLTFVLKNETPYPFDALPNILQKKVYWMI